MSDAYVPNIPSAPPAPAPTPAAPAPASEVPINPSPTSAPAPLSGSPPPSLTTRAREAVERAFERAKVERQGPAQAKIGHNQPPEPMEREKPAKPQEPPLNLKKRPSEQEQESTASASPPRGEGGRFAPRGQAPSNSGLTSGQQARQPGQGYQLPPNVPYAQPPRRMAEHAKAEWAAAPESVRGEVYRMHRNFNAAYQRYRQDHEAMNSIRPYHDLARQQGVPLAQALGSYIGIENKLRQDPIGGLDVIVNNLNLRTQDGRRLGLADVAYHVLSRTPEQHQMTQAQNQQTAMAQQFAQLQYQQQMLAQQQAQMHYERRFSHTRGIVDRFAETHPRVDELGKAIERELGFGFDLPTAYARADRLYPPRAGTQAAQTRTPAPQTRSSDRSISGAPDGGTSNGAARRKSANSRESVAYAMRRYNGSL
jgi:hypothetical protein